MGRHPVTAPYDRVAGVYDRVVGPLWDHTVGRPAVACLRRLLRRHVGPGAVALDVGAGAGRSTARLLAEAPVARVVALDRSAAMLARARAHLADPRVALVQGDATRLPFPDDAFDVVAGVWVLETLTDPLAAVRECLRCVRPDGLVLAVCCTRPLEPLRRGAARLMELVMRRRAFAGRFLPEEELPLHRCTVERAQRYEFGFATVATFGQRRQLSAELLPPARRPR